jgi:quercetin dioxygenase-like cupin family protein
MLIRCTYASDLFAHDWKRVNPKMVQTLNDTTLIHAYVSTLAPGEKSALHTHPAAFFYALTDCKLKVYYSDGKTEEWDLKAGDSGYSGPERQHITENTGAATAKFLLVELKEHPYKVSKSK